MSFGCLPYIMRYEDYKFSRFKDLYIQLARWCNQPQFFKKKSFREFCEANQYYTKSNKNCRSYKTMLNFYQQYPDIASKYFELKYETVNEYDLSYSYARIKSEPCRRCYSSSITWDKALSGNNMGWIEYYFDRSLDIICLTRTISCCKSKYDINAVCSLVFRTISSSSLNDLFKILDSFPISSVDIAMVPQFSNFEDATVNLINIFLDDESLSFEEIGNKLRSGIGNLDSFKKYGENHSKLAALLDLVVIREADHKQFVSLSPVGKYLKDTTYSEILNFSTKQILRIPIIQQLIIHSKVDEAFIEDIIALSGAKPSTIKRRTSSIKYLIDLLFQVADPDSARRLINIKSKN